MYEGLKVNFWLWNIVGGAYGYKELIRLPRKQKKALKKSILQDIITVDRTYVKECPRPKKLPTFSYKQMEYERKFYCYSSEVGSFRKEESISIKFYLGLSFMWSLEYLEYK